MTVRPPRSKFVSAVEKRLGRSLSDQEMLRLAACARALKVRKAQHQRVYKPRMELWDDGGSPLVTAVLEVPGLRPADVTVDVVDGRLVVSGERRQQGFSMAPKTQASPIANGNGSGNGTGTNPSEPTDPDVCVRASEETLAHAGTVTVLQVRELKYGFFRRVIAVPAGCTSAHLQASMENGMLTVSWPRDPGARLADLLLATKTESALQLNTGAGAGAAGSGFTENGSAACV
ncbi:hypothetical protein GSI_09266 [Ganoderma sinense ZZ0214-1]|uniref:SHSP domain-containing protein n=1 Tax=Ganoderma sinense ZZ0214-1 TaxID=1077348 RepID=A0A2G8S651_9APHY|nr:hypothetical protein GSI_09266 [Ganoderma sinense ZZ0214-1]